MFEGKNMLEERGPRAASSEYIKGDMQEGGVQEQPV
jgi:hypothetical protein